MSYARIEKTYSVERVIDFYATFLEEKREKGNDFRPVVALDVDGTLTMISKPSMQSRTKGVVRGASVQVVQGLAELGVPFFAVSAWNKAYETVARIRDLGLAKEFLVSGDEDLVPMHEYSWVHDDVPYPLFYKKIGSVISIQGKYAANYFNGNDWIEDKTFFRQKAFFGFFTLKEEIERVSDVYFLDDSPENIVSIRRDVARFNLFPDATVHYFNLASPRNAADLSRDPKVDGTLEEALSKAKVAQGMVVEQRGWPAAHHSAPEARKASPVPMKKNPLSVTSECWSNLTGLGDSEPPSPSCPSLSRSREGLSKSGTGRPNNPLRRCGDEGRDSLSSSSEVETW